MEKLNMKHRIAILFVCAGAAMLLTACGDNGKPEAEKKSVVTETVKSADKTADYLVGTKAVEQGKKITGKLDKMQSTHNKQLESALEN